MLFTSLDEIVKRKLIDSGYPIHYYFEYLSHAAGCLRELNFDVLDMINTVRLPVNCDDHTVDLPEDFVTDGDISVGIPVGQFLQPVVKMDKITRLRNKNPTTYQYEDYQGATPSESVDGLYLNPGWNWFWNVNSFGEPTGRQFGGNGGATLNGYTVVTERRQIQLTETFTSSEIVLMYLSDGQSADNATHIDVGAFACIEAWIDWKRSPNRNNDRSPEGMYYYNQRRLLKARKHQLTTLQIRQILHNAYSATIKN
jgi:hypothetical protein